VRPDELEFRPENAHVVNHSGMSVLVAAKTMSLFTMDPLSEAVLRYCESKRRFTLEEVVSHLSNDFVGEDIADCLLYTSPSPRDLSTSRMPSSA